MHNLVMATRCTFNDGKYYSHVFLMMLLKVYTSASMKGIVTIGIF